MFYEETPTTREILGALGFVMGVVLFGVGIGYWIFALGAPHWPSVAAAHCAFVAGYWLGRL